MTSPPVMIGSNSPAEQALEDPGVRWPIEWIAMRGDDRLMLQTLRPSPDLQLISRMLYYRNSNVPDPPERYRGEYPGVGYITTGYSNLGSGSHMFDSLFVYRSSRLRSADIDARNRNTTKCNCRPD